MDGAFGSHISRSSPAVGDAASIAKMPARRISSICAGVGGCDDAKSVGRSYSAGSINVVSSAIARIAPSDISSGPSLSADWSMIVHTAITHAVAARYRHLIWRLEGAVASSTRTPAISGVDAFDAISAQAAGETQAKEAAEVEINAALSAAIVVREHAFEHLFRV